MDLWFWFCWGILLVLQNATFTLVSRARNSSSLKYHAWASLLSNGVWFISNFILFGAFIDIMRNSNWWLAGGVGLFYVICTMAGSLWMHYLALNHIEKSPRLKIV